MANVQHIKKRETFFTGLTVTHCGKTLAPGQLGSRSAPLCGKCMSKAGWVKGRRK